MQVGRLSARAIPAKVHCGFASGIAWKQREHFRASKKNGKALAMHEAQNVVYESRMGVREVTVSAVACDAGQLERMLIIENMVDLLGVRRPTGGNGNVDGMEIAEIDIDHAAG
jgi:hypothetical protein